MQLKLFDILSAVIPGALVFCFLFFTSFIHVIEPQLIEQKISIYKDISTILTAVFVIASYITGYLVHAIGSWVEPLLWATWGGRPTQILFSDESSRIGLGSEKTAVLSWLKSKSSDPRISALSNEQIKPDDYRKLFQIAKNLAFSNNSPTIKTRIEEFNNSYIFSRNILVAFLICLGCVITLVVYRIISFKWIVIQIGVLLIVWWRARDRAIYYSREILVAAYYQHKAQE